MKKNIHFFGCSFTVGQELPDQDIFPWIHDCKNQSEYYSKFGFQDIILLDDYIQECKKLSYPSIIHNFDNTYNCINHAEIGSSLKNEIYKTMQLIESKQTDVDFVVFQIPGYEREMIMTNDNNKLNNYVLHNLIPTPDNTDISFFLKDTINKDELAEYAKYKLLSHSPMHWQFHGQIELMLFQGYLESKNIHSIFVQLDFINNRFDENLRSYFNNTAEIFKVSDYFTGKKLPGNHFDRESHAEFAKYIKMLIDDKLTH